MSDKIKVLILVTQDDIDKGEAMDCSRCPVALALQRTLGCPSTVSGEALGWGKVRPERKFRLGVGAYSNPYDRVHHARIPRSVKRFVNRFDAGKPVKPFRFWLKEI
jgi:hypothetical protein